MDRTVLPPGSGQASVFANQQPPEQETPAMPPEPAQTQSTVADSIERLGQTNPVMDESNIYCLTIVGQIEGHIVLPPQNKTSKYEHIIPQLVAAEQSDRIEGVLVILNTVGGDVEAGLAIAEMIASMSKPTVTLVLGGGHSIGVPIAVASNYSLIAESATMTIHPIRMNGMVIGVPQSFEYLEKMQERVTRFITAHSRISDDDLRQLMLATGELARDIGSTVVGRDAVLHGLIDGVGGLGAAMQQMRRMIEEYRSRRPQGVIQ